MKEVVLLARERERDVRAQLQQDDYAIWDDYNLWSLRRDQRWDLYRYWRLCYLKAQSDRLRILEKECLTVEARMRELKAKKDAVLFRQPKILAMTTTGAARMMAVLREVGPRIVIVEEAAEVLESHLLAATTGSLRAATKTQCSQKKKNTK